MLVPLPWRPSAEGVQVLDAESVARPHPNTNTGAARSGQATVEALKRRADTEVARGLGRIVLYVSGPPLSQPGREQCAAQALRCGGDPLRTFDQEIGSLNRFIEHVQRIPAVCHSPATMVVMTHIDPLAFSVVVTRRRIENAVPVMRQALWALFVEPRQEQRFIVEAQEYGTLLGGFDSAPLWIGPGEMQFLVLSSQVAEDVDLRQRTANCLDWFSRRRERRSGM
jgi:hypothetical protein